jgi:hypothetical protein
MVIHIGSFLPRELFHECYFLLIHFWGSLQNLSFPLEHYRYSSEQFLIQNNASEADWFFVFILMCYICHHLSPEFCPWIFLYAPHIMPQVPNLTDGFFFP